ncbi:hypothetical protein E6C60_3031 [Paenibacillus algicola]|uniref:Uncharacterized protein n=1 Tax=Paenibacillus algicola TaxID=2565926 RepID=A0A4P8XLU6_9BACL|nr:hypothetical protein E6C60_3031 [Paenibacillus algicola]
MKWECSYPLACQGFRLDRKDPDLDLGLEGPSVLPDLDPAPEQPASRQPRRRQPLYPSSLHLR